MKSNNLSAFLGVARDGLRWGMCLSQKVDSIAVCLLKADYEGF